VCMPFTSTRPADALGRYLDDLSLWFVRETLTDGRGQGSNWFSTTFFSTASRATPRRGSSGVGGSADPSKTGLKLSHVPDRSTLCTLGCLKSI
jgi:hypothetical protein